MVRLYCLIENKKNLRICEAFLYKVIKKALSTLKFRKKVEIGIVVTTDKKIQKLNKKYRGKDLPTDVLSFEMSKTNGRFIIPSDDFVNLGEIIISYDSAKRQAKAKNHPIKKEISILLIHGLLHLLGFEHENVDKETKNRMFGLEKKILSQIL